MTFSISPGFGERSSLSQVTFTSQMINIKNCLLSLAKQQHWKAFHDQGYVNPETAVQDRLQLERRYSDRLCLN